MLLNIITIMTAWGSFLHIIFILTRFRTMKIGTYSIWYRRAYTRKFYVNLKMPSSCHAELIPLPYVSKLKNVSSSLVTSMAMYKVQTNEFRVLCQTVMCMPSWIKSGIYELSLFKWICLKIKMYQSYTRQCLIDDEILISKFSDLLILGTGTCQSTMI